MPDLTFEVTGAQAVPYAASPLLSLSLRIRSAPATEAIDCIALECQVQIEVARRRHTEGERRDLEGVVGDASRWSSPRPLLWALARATVPAFSGEVAVDLPIPCTYDFNVASARYLDALEDGEVPLVLLFSGTIFHPGKGGALQIARIPWTKETRWRLPVRVHAEVMDLYYPSSAALMLRRDVLERLQRYRARSGLPSWEQAIESLLPAEVEP